MSILVRKLPLVCKRISILLGLFIASGLKLIEHIFIFAYVLM
ncbi:hypothetical protein N8D25_13845 (plasmid) [Enterococcus faecium]